MVIFDELSVPMAFKVMLVPKDVRHAFGVSHIPDVAMATSCGEHWF